MQYLTIKYIFNYYFLNRSSSTYRFLKNQDILPLPCQSTIYKYLSLIKTQCGFDEQFFQLLKKKNFYFKLKWKTWNDYFWWNFFTGKFESQYTRTYIFRFRRLWWRNWIIWNESKPWIGIYFPKFYKQFYPTNSCLCV